MEECQSNASGEGPRKDVSPHSATYRSIVVADADHRGVYCPGNTITRIYTDLSLRKRGPSQTVTLERVEALSNTQAVLSEKTSSTLESPNTTVNQVNDAVQALEMTATTSHQSTSLALEQLNDKMQYLSGLSTGQSETLNATCNAILELLKQQLPVRSQQSAESSRSEAIPSGAAESSRETELEGRAQDDVGDDERLQHAIDRLCHLTKEKEKTVFSAEAETIIHDVQQIFELLLEADQEQYVEDRKGKRPRENDTMDDQLLYQHEVKRIKGFLSASHCIAINDKGQCEPDMVVPFSMVLPTGDAHCHWRFCLDSCLY